VKFWQPSLVTIRGGVVIGSLIDQPLARSIGLEVELSEFGTIKDWDGIRYTINSDGSVYPSGQEMVLPPLSGRELQEVLYKLGIALITNQCKVNDTCGLHVHVDAKDFGWWEIRKLLIIWLGIEQEMFKKFVTGNREESKYCIPYLKDNGPGPFRSFIEKLIDPITPISVIKTAWLQIFYDHNFSLTKAKKLSFESKTNKHYENQKKNKYYDPRYYAMNVHSWMYRRTIEFRLKEGTVNGAEIRDWALLCGWIVEVVNRITFRQALRIYYGGIEELKDLVSTSPFSIKTSFILPSSVREYIKSKGIH